MSYRRCLGCRTWHLCSGYNFYLPAEIESQFCKHHVLFLLVHLDVLEDGEYPPDPAPTGYIGGNKPIFRAGARFQRPADLFSEITARLERTGMDGDTLIHEVQTFNANLLQLSQAARNALNYCCGNNRKNSSYPRWLRNRRYYHKIIQFT